MSPARLRDLPPRSFAPPIAAIAVAVLIALALMARAEVASAQAPGELSGNLPSAGGLAIVFWGGGAIEDVNSAANAGGCDAISTWTTRGGGLVGYVFGAPEFVNARFMNAFPGGEIATATGLIVVCRGESSPPAGTPPLAAPNLSEYLPATSEIEAYRAAVGLRDAGEHQQAATAFSNVASSGGAMAPMARLRAGQMLLIARQDAPAAATLQQAVGDSGLPAALRIIARMDAATALNRIGDGAQALAMLEGITVENGANASQVAYALWNRAQILRDQGGAWTDLARSVTSGYPTTSYALSALQALEQAGVTVPALEAGLVYYRHHENDAARSRFDQVVASGGASDAAMAWFYLGAIEEREGDEAAAIAAYEQSIALAPNGTLADDAHWWAGVLLQPDDPGAAATHFETLASAAPDSTFAVDARVRAALIRADQGATDAALTSLNTLLSNSTGYDAARAARWIRVLGGTAPPPATLHPRSVFAVLEAAGGQADQPLPPAALTEGVSGATANWSAAASWMQTQFGASPGAPLSDDQGLLRLAFGLNAAGEGPVARTILNAYMNSMGGRPYAILELSRLAASAGMYDISVSAAERLLLTRTPAQRLQAPTAIEQLAYPAHFSQELIAAAEAEGVPPLLLLALVRRESMFYPEVVSSAGARGLAQVMPGTGEGIAAALGVPYDPDDLFDPQTALRFGAYYLGQQIDGFDGDVFGALAAYNAGPGSASRWFQEQAQPGADWYIETVDFGQTRAYLRIVIEDYAWYRYIYGHASTPAMR